MWSVWRCGVFVMAVEGGEGAYVVSAGLCDDNEGLWRSVCCRWGGVGYV